MGIRIEDDVLIGAAGAADEPEAHAAPSAPPTAAEDLQVLSAAVPKAIDDIEALMRG